MRPIVIPREGKDTISPDRLALIRGGLIGASFHLPYEEVFLFPFMDYLYLLFQPTQEEDPIAFLFWKGDNCIHSSFADLYYARKYSFHLGHGFTPPDEGIVISDAEDIWLTIHKVSRTALKDLEDSYPQFTEPIDLDTEIKSRVLIPDNDLMRRAAFFLQRTDGIGSTNWLGLSTTVIEQFKSLLIKSAECSRSPYPWCPSLDLSIMELNYQRDLLPFLDGFRYVLDDVFQDASASQAMQLRDHVPQLGNVFCVIRTVQSGARRLSSFPFTAGLLLSHEQRNKLSTWCSLGCAGKKDRCCPALTHEGETCVNDLEIPLGPLSRSVADSVFCSGIIDFGRKPDDRIWDRTDPGNQVEQRRRKVEKCIYPTGNEASLYYVPIHVEGIPWLAIFTFSPATNREDRWLHNYTFYRDVIQRAASRLRTKARQEYLRLASDVASRYMDSWTHAPEDICSTVNRAWETLARIFPMPSLRLHHSPHPDGTASVDGTSVRRMIGQWICECSTNQFFGPPQVRWGQSNPQDILDSLVSTLRYRMSERWQVPEKSGRYRAMIAHAIDAQLDSLSTAIYEVPEENSRDALEIEWRKLKEFSDYSMAAIDHRRRAILLNTFRSDAMSIFLNFVSQSVRETFKKLSIPQLARDQLVPARAKLLSGSFDQVTLDPGISSTCLVKYHPTHVRAIVFELVANAMRRLKDSFPKLTASLASSQKGAAEVPLFFQIANSTDKHFDDLNMLCEELTNGTGGHLGIMNIRMFCKLWDYAAPEWKPVSIDDGTTDMFTRCQVGTLYLKEAK